MSWRLQGVVLSIVLILLLVSSHALPYFRVEEGTRQCFIEEVPENTLIVAKYKLLDWELMRGSYSGRGQQDPPARMYVEVRDPRQTLLLEHDLVEEGQFGFTSVVSGEHQVCVIAAPSASYYGGAKLLRCQLTMDFGEQAVDYSSIAKAEHLSAIEVEVRKLGDKVRAIRQEQDYQKSRESDYRDHSESINASVMYWSIAQTALLIAAGLAQLYLLTKFFKAKKLA